MPVRASDLNAPNQAWNVSKWINAKFVQFPFDVYYYGAYIPPTTQPGLYDWGASHGGTQPNPTWSGAGHVGGGLNATFVPANTWIMLYDNQRQEWGNDHYHPQVDPTRFAFRIPAHVADMPYQEVRVLVESINSPFALLPVQQRAQGQWDAQSEWNINGTRDGNHAAFHAARGIITADIVGRIGNVVVDDSADPAWSQVFWNTDRGNVLSHQNVSMGIATYSNWFESTQNHIGSIGNVPRPIHPINRTVTAGGFINRFHTLAQWHNMDMTLLENPSVPYTLPIQRNPIPQFDTTVQKLGYENQFSVQTLGLYNLAWSEMWVLPRYFPVGDFYTMPQGNLNERFFLFANDPFDVGGQARMFWDSHMDFGNWRFAPTAILGASAFANSGPTGSVFPNMSRASAIPWNGRGNFQWRPDLEHRMYHTLADPRAKINTVERNSPSFIAAQALGSLHTIHLGDPAFIRIPPELMTFIGGSVTGDSPTLTTGRVGQNQPFHSLVTSPGGPAHQQRAFVNAQRWHARFSLPSTTQVIWERNLEQGLFEGRHSNQHIGVNFTFRTHAHNGLWDLAIYTGATEGAAAPSRPNFEVPINREPWEIRTPPPPTWHPGGRGVRRPVRSWMWPPTVPPAPGFPVPGYADPGTPIIILDYSNPATTDRTTIGTH
jgi:hypothetical protein